MKALLTVTAACEALTGFALTLDPPLVVRLLLGAEPSGVGLAVSRVAGIALVGLGLACWPGGDATAAGRAPLRAMLVYSVLATLYLGYLGVASDSVGRLLWPAVVAHAGLSAWCIVVALRLAAREPPGATP